LVKIGNGESENPFNVKEIVKVLNLSDCGIATSGIYEREKYLQSHHKKL